MSTKRSTQRMVAALLREARQALGVQRQTQVWKRTTEIQDHLKKKFPGIVITIGPYINDAWTIFTLDNSACQRIRYIEAKDLNLGLDEWVRLFSRKFGLEAVMPTKENGAEESCLTKN